MAAFALILMFCAAVMLQLSSAAVIYTRWGRSKCSDGAKALYTGYVAKGHWEHSGSGPNYLCLHNSPKFLNTVAGAQTDSSWIYGVEYEFKQGFSNKQPFSYENNGGADLWHNDAICVVCFSPKASVQHMVAGRPDCPSSDMHLEYSGFLASERHSHPAQGEYICLDYAPEPRPGGAAASYGGLLYPVQVGCGALSCPPFVDGAELTCAVCTI